MAITKSQKERNRIRKRFTDLKILYGGRCTFCDKTWLLEFAHVRDSGLNGRSRGKIKRYYNIKNNIMSYLLTCKDHNYKAWGYWQ